MKDFNVAILGCGTVGGGVAKIMLEMSEQLSGSSTRRIHLSKIVELSASEAVERFEIPAHIFCGGGKDLSKEEANRYIEEILQDKNIDLVVETIGGSNDFVENLAISVCHAGKHLVTANKALLAERGVSIFEAAKINKVSLGYEAAVCGAIPVIKTIKESFTGDQIESISGILNGTSNYILTMMQHEGMDFHEALKLAQENGYAEADPTLDIDGGDAAHKLILLIRLAFGVNITMEELARMGIQNIKKEDIEFASEINAKIKLICFAQKLDGKIYATVCPMMVKNSNFLAEVSGATNAVRFLNKYSGRHILIGAGAGSLETASSIVADIVFAARYADRALHEEKEKVAKLQFTDARHFKFPYIITFETEDIPGITGLTTTCIGKQKINIDTVSHNRHEKDRAIFSIVTMPCTLRQVEDAILEVKEKNPSVLLSEPKVIPILY
ncbi:MAG: homoserine dehydrogenase [Bacteroidales bacterium]|nr:homoserine dehydrogenase [Bacteroidales bacterium]